MGNRHDVLIEYMNEHYAHAPDHEHLRSQITSVLCASAFVVIGISLEKLAGIRLGVAGIIVLSMGVLNLILNDLHNNRAEAHIKTARSVRDHLLASSATATSSTTPTFEDIFAETKKGNLSATWQVLPAIVALVGLLMTVVGFLGCRIP